MELRSIHFILRSFCDTVDKIGESEVDVVRVRDKFTNCRSREYMYNYINVRIIYTMV